MTFKTCTQPQSSEIDVRQNALLAFFVFLISLLSASAPRADELTPAKRADIQTLFKLSGTGNLAMRMAIVAVQQISESVRQVRSDLPARAFTIIEEETQKSFRENIDTPNGLIARFVPIYAEIFTHDEVKELIAFHRSPIGTKLRDVQDALFKKGMELGQQWSTELSPELQQRIQDRFAIEGYDLGNTSKPERNQ
jgi:uncharacterized protein